MLLLLILPLYVGIFVIFYRFRGVIKVMSEIEKLFSDMSSEDSADEVDKRDFLTEKVKNGEFISNSKTPWTEERLRKASYKVIDRLYEKCANPPPVKINKKEALEMGKSVCPVVIEMYAEGLKTLIDQLPYIGGKYSINTEKLKANISANKLFCDNLSVQIGSKMIAQVGGNSATRVGLSLAAMTWDAVEPIRKVVINERGTTENLLSTRKFVEGEESDNRASKGDGASS